MNLLFLRHAIAIDREDPECPPSDFDRALTPEGRAKMIEGARGMKTLGIRFDAILSSPLVRARQTAEVVAEVYSHPAGIERLDALAPGMNPTALLRELARTYPQDASLLLVGHEPDFGDAVAVLGFGRDAGALALKKGGLACVEIAALPCSPRGRLLWLLTPRLLRAAGGG